MADFGDDLLFAEFEKERLPKSRFIHKNEQKESVLGKSTDDLKSSNGKQIEVTTLNSDDNESMSDSEFLSSNGKTKALESPSSPDLKDGQGGALTQRQNSEQISIRNLQEKLKRLEEENTKLKQYAKLLDVSRCMPEGEGPTFEVLFFNTRNSRKLHSKIEMTIGALLEQLKNDTDMPSLKLRPHYSYTCLGNASDCSEATVIGCSQYHSDFLIDQVGWPLIDDKPELTDGWDIPPYEQIFQEAIPIDEEENNAPKKQKRPKAACFNCEGDHNVSDCPEKKDFARISKNKRQFMEKFASPAPLQLKNGRYHIEEDPRFADFKPGVISNDLRKALGLHRDEVPPYIYQMRVVGYPPGHLMEAELRTSGLVMFDKHGRETNVQGDSMEDGEVDDAMDPSAVQYDPVKVIDYPGFNVPLPSGVRDEHSKFGMPPMRLEQQKEVLVAFMTNQGAKRKLEEEENNRRKKKMRHDTEDMDLDDGSGAAELKHNPSTSSSRRSSVQSESDTTASKSAKSKSSDEEFRRPGSRSGSVSRQSSRQGTREGTPTDIEDLEEQRKVILAQIMAEDGNDSEVQVVDSCSGEDGEDVGQLSNPLSPDDSERGQTLEQNIAAQNTSFQSWSGTPQTQSRSSSVGLSYGTPIQGTALDSPAALPPASLFAKDITDHLPFENLPDSVGTFNKLRGLLVKVKEAKSKIKK